MGLNVFAFVGFGLGSLIFGEAQRRLGLNGALAIFVAVQAMAAGLSVLWFRSGARARGLASMVTK